MSKQFRKPPKQDRYGDDENRHHLIRQKKSFGSEKASKRVDQLLKTRDLGRLATLDEVY